MKDGKLFNVRVYALLVNADSELLIAEEYHYDTFMRKLPGGGLQFGEGPLECLMRELREELGESIEEAAHFYTTDFFIQSAFNANHQVIALYYKADVPAEWSARYRETIVPSKNGEEYFRWVKIEALRAEDFTLPADQAAIRQFIASQQD